MVFCCLDTTGSSAAAGEAYQRQTVADFPGRRGLVKTSGNAWVMASSPWQQPPPSASSPPPPGFTDTGLLQVAVPAGTSSGDKLHVRAPDGQLIEAVVPPGMHTGSTFMVRVPRAQTLATTTNNRAVSPSPPPSPPFLNALSMTPPSNEVITHMSLYSVPPIPPPFTDHLPTAEAQPVLEGEPAQRVILVNVPPHIASGTVLHVSIPDEPGRVVAAVVPEGVRQFPVAYTPRGGAWTTTVSVYHPNTGAMPPQGYAANNSCARSRPSNNNNSAGASDFVLPFLGGASLGAVGVSILEHARQQPDAGDAGGGWGDY